MIFMNVKNVEIQRGVDAGIFSNFLPFIPILDKQMYVYQTNRRAAKNQQQIGK